MSAGDLAVGGIILLWVAGAVYILLRNKRKGRSSCGCNCPGCAKGNAPNVTIEEECTCGCRKD